MKVNVIIFIVGLIVGVAAAKHYFDGNREETTDKTHRTITRIIVKNPDGTEKEVETIEETETSKTKAPARNQNLKRTNVSVLAVNDFKASTIKPIYGISVTREVIGNVTVGIFMLENRTAGASVGLNF